MEFSGKTAVVTGGAGGVGKCLCIELVKLGCNVAVIDIDEKRIAATVQELEQMGEGRVIGLRCDLTKEAMVLDVADKVFETFGNVHLLFNNAGVGLGEAQKKLWDLPISDWRWGIDVNVMGIVHGIKAFVPRMLEKDEEGFVINSSSANGGLYSLPNTPIYAATKAAVTSISEVLFQQLQREGGKIRTAILFPGPHTVNTGILASSTVRPDDYVEDETQRKVAYESMDDLIKATGLRIQLTEPEDVARFALDGIRKGDFWMIPDSEQTDMAVGSRTQVILDRGTPGYAF
ncbi:SDR family NAD(P)-dependent oxidoreductase [Henriciella litoralis]|uniref:SDR family NAD(P)-dependent oxidoreductase n=1 Tax=Henriciella litoralis TaxID=568102 RepID=UPI001F271276|nr:SDR family NAD(P)-dependent oxidoreductase [Henriciella litoralis]